MRKLMCNWFNLIPEKEYFDLICENTVLEFRNKDLTDEIKSLKEQMAYLKAELSMKND